MVKIFLPFLLCSLTVCAADLVKKDTPLSDDASKIKSSEEGSPVLEMFASLIDQHNWAAKGCYDIQPNSFTPVGKTILKKYIAVWHEAAQEAQIPTDRGLAQIFAVMHHGGPEQLIQDVYALLKANEYHAEYLKSPSKEIEKLTKKMFRHEGNYYFPGAQETVTDRVRITRQNEFYNIMYKRHESPEMPTNNLVAFYNDQTKASAQEVLKLNIANKNLKADAICGVTLLAAYYLQQDQNEKHY